MTFPESLIPLKEAFLKELLREDDLGTVIRSQIHLENILIKIISVTLPNPQHLSDLRGWEYSQTVKIALALGVDGELKPILNALGTLRNNFAHKLDYALNDQIIKSLYDCLAPKFKSVINQIAPTLYKAKNVKAKNYNELDNRAKLSVIVITVWVALSGYFLSITPEGRKILEISKLTQRLKIDLGLVQVFKKGRGFKLFALFLFCFLEGKGSRSARKIPDQAARV